jgi:hypothetical protein
MQAISGEQALKGRRPIKSRGTGEQHWRTDYLGKPGDGTLKDEPQAFLIEMQANETIMPHFHEVDQYQVFVSGSGSVGRSPHGILAVHYADHHTGYGPIVAGPLGYSYFTLRAKSDPGAHYLHKPGYREALKPSAKRHGVADGIVLSTEPVLMDRKELAEEKLMPELEGDGRSVSLIRMGPGMSHTGPDPRATGGQYYLVLNGNLEAGAASYPKWSTLFLAPAADAPLAFKAGAQGLEALLLQFSRTESQ